MQEVKAHCEGMRLWKSWLRGFNNHDVEVRGPPSSWEMTKNRANGPSDCLVTEML